MQSEDVSDDQLAADLAALAGEVVLAVRQDGGRQGLAGRELGLRADAAAQAAIAAGLARRRPSDRILSEEALDDPARHHADRVWIVDPLDGTREYAERDSDGGWRDDFAIHVALWQRDRGLVAGAVAVPARQIVFRSDRPGRPANPSAGRPIRVAVSRTRPPAFALQLAASGRIDCVQLGSAGIKAMAVLEGAVDAYVHAGGQHEWDSAAPVAVAVAAGLVATRLDGSPLAWNQPVPWLPDLFICRPAVADELRALLGEVGTA